MEPNFEQTAQQAAAFQKIWTETATKLFQAGMNSPTPPPEMLRQMRNGIFQALAQSWDEFMRSPQFLEQTRQWMENAISFRKLTTDFLSRVRNQAQAPSREDLESVMLQVRHMEKRLLDRIEALSTQLETLQKQPRGARGSRLKTNGGGHAAVRVQPRKSRRSSKSVRKVST